MGALTLTVSREHPAFAGHFPGAPILPGVVLLDEMVHALEREAPPGAGRWRIGAAKFLKPVRPGETLTLEYEQLPKGSIRFSVSSAGQPVAHGLLLLESAPRAAPSAAARADASQWVGEPERGSATLLRMMMFVALHLGRPLSRGILYLIAAYFFAFAPTVRRHARVYLRRSLGREPGALDRFRQLFAFSTTILDRFYLARGRYERLSLSCEGQELMDALLTRGEGAFLLGSHLGSFEVMGAVGRDRPEVRVAMAMYERQPTRVTRFLRAGQDAAPEIIELGQIDAMLRIRDCLDQGKFVGMLADRTLGDAPAQLASFLGSPALFPSGPMRAAAALRRPVIFMTGLYRGGNRYHVVFRQIADFSAVARGDRESAVHAAVARYAALLEEYCRSDPYNWFNFYDFWHGAEAPPASAPGASA